MAAPASLSNVFLAHDTRDNVRAISEHDVALREAFGDGRYDKMARHLADGADDIKLAQLLPLCSILHKPENVVSVVRAGLVPVLTGLLASADDSIRERSTEALARVAAVPRGQVALDAAGTISCCAELLDDACPGVHVWVFQLLANQTSTAAGAAPVLRAGFVTVVTRRLDTLPPDVLALALDLFTHSVRTDTGREEATSCGTIAALATVLERPDVPALALHDKAAACLGIVCGTERGREVAVEANATRGIAHAMNSDAPATRRAATAALQRLSIADGGKRQAAACSGMGSLLTYLLNDLDAGIVRNVIQCIANIAELPAGRAAVMPALPVLRRRADETTRWEPDIGVAARSAAMQLDREASARYFM